jgi:tetratricopeptide (TPR) repeat protein
MNPVACILVVLVALAACAPRPAPLVSADAPTTPATPASIDELRAEVEHISRLLYDQGDYLATIRRVDAVLARAKGDGPERAKLRSTFLMAAGAAHFYLGDHRAASRNLNEAVREDPEFELSYFFLGRVAASRKDYGEALRQYNRAIALNPRFLEALFHRGLVRASGHDFEGAIADFSAIVAIKSNSAPAYAYRGLVHERLRNRAAAAADYRRALALEPGFSIAREGLNRLARAGAPPPRVEPPPTRRREGPPVVEF